MFVRCLETSEPSTRLIMPVASRDAPLSVQWLNGPQGRDTLLMMGVAEELIGPATLDQEITRIASFIERQDQYNWMIEFEGRVVGSIWVDLRQSSALGAPAVSYMIGDPAVRRKGVGRRTLHAVTQFMFRRGARQIFARALVANYKSAGLLTSLGFVRLSDSYVDPDDGLQWQNFVLLPESR